LLESHRNASSQFGLYSDRGIDHVVYCGVRVGGGRNHVFFCRQSKRKQPADGGATALLYDKMEQFRTAPLDSPLWTNGDDSDDVIQETTFTRIWEINSATPQSVSITVYAESPLRHRLTELIRATLNVANTF
jgi:hypothetical protein